VSRAAKQERRLTGLEQAFLAYEARSGTVNLQIGGLSVFTGEFPSVDEARRFVAARLGDLPELELALRRAGRRLSWARESKVDLTWHVGEWVTEPGELAAAVGELMARPLARDAPPWQFWVVHGYSADEWAILFKAHHALMDGAAMTEATCRLAGYAPPTRPPVAHDHGVRRKKADLLTIARGTRRYVAGFFPLATRSFAHGKRTGERRFAWTATPLARLRELASRHECTVNDIFLAALATVLREWDHTPWRRRPCPVWTLVPADLHDRHGDNEISAKVVNLRVALPCDEPDPHRRLALIKKATGVAKGSGNIGVAGAATRSAPRWLVRAVFAATFSRWHVNLLASNVRGPRRQLDYAGAPLTRMVPLGFLPRHHPLATYVITHHDQACVGFAVDAALPDGEELCLLWSRALDDLGAPPKQCGGGQDGCVCSSPPVAPR
jgi:hypothetical protein